MKKFNLLSAAMVALPFAWACNTSSENRIFPKSAELTVVIPHIKGDVETYGVCYFPKGQTDKRTLVYGDNADAEGKFTAKVGNLTPGKSYEYGTFVTYSKGGKYSSDYGKLKSFKTPKELGKLSVSDPYNIHFCEATVDWAIEGLEDFSYVTKIGVAHGYGDDGPVTGRYYPPEQEINGEVVTKQTFKMEQLSPNETYNYCPYIIVDGVEYFGETKTFTTPSIGDALSVSLSVENPTSNSVDYTAEIRYRNSDDKVEFDEVKAVLTYWKTSDKSSKDYIYIRLDDNGHTASGTVKNLDDDTEYSFQIAFFNWWSLFGVGIGGEKLNYNAALYNGSTEEAKTLVGYDWLYGTWHYSGYVGYMRADSWLYITKDNIKVVLNGYTEYNGLYSIDKNQEYFHAGRVIHYDEILHAGGNMYVLHRNSLSIEFGKGEYYRKVSNGFSNSASSSYGSRSSNSSTTFYSADSVIGYLSDKTYYSSSGTKLQVRPEGMYVNDLCVTGAPQVTDFAYNKAMVVAYSTLGRTRFIVDPVHNLILDESGDKYYMR